MKLIIILCSVAGCLFSWQAYAADQRHAHPTMSEEDIRRYGERIYREGILPSGEPVHAIVKGDIEVEGSMFSCQSCHMRGGIGSFEGGIYTPPTNGSSLFNPLKFTYKGIVQEQVPPIRPAYTVKSLAEVLRYGDDPSGRILNDVMPRYILNDDDMAIFVSYLKMLSSQFSPGVTDASISFATVIAEDVSPEERDEMLDPLQKYVDNKNKLADYFETSAGWRSRRMAEAMFVNSKEFARKKLSLSHWVLKGPPETWRGQLDEYYRREPVFALVGGITTGEWGPIHKFCEENQIPSIFPYTDFPVISDTDWYTLYLSKGYYQEGEGAARYLHAMHHAIADQPIIQVMRDSREGRALMEGFRKTWLDFGHEKPLTIMLKEGEKFKETLLSRLSLKQKPAIVLIWDGDGAVSTLETMAAAKERPRMIFLSYSYTGKKVMEIKENVRDIVYITHPYRFPKEKGNTDSNAMIKVLPKDATKIVNQTFSIIEVLNMAFMRMKGYYYRDNFLDVMDCIMDLEVPYYERISFGPGQRYAAKGCYIAQLSKGEKPELIKKSNWVSH
jgi:ABC-type branched-subunit amino acid transport system substrate-binding protein